MKNLILKSRFKVPIYNVNVWVIVAHDGVKALRRLAKRFEQKVPKDDAWVAMCVTDDKGEIGMFFHSALIDADSVGHEIVHAVDFAMASIGSEAKATDEVAAYLNGYLHKRVHAILKKNNIKIHRK